MDRPTASRSARWSRRLRRLTLTTIVVAAITAARDWAIRRNDRRAAETDSREVKPPVRPPGQTHPDPPAPRPTPHEDPSHR